ncbi:hypothetical protein J6590_067351 [Homalodisca vitripennis]|nr:hypothetical protein J6590_067351 [Homalodisca vitripennis]
MFCRDISVHVERIKVLDAWSSRNDVLYPIFPGLNEHNNYADADYYILLVKDHVYHRRVLDHNIVASSHSYQYTPKDSHHKPSSPENTLTKNILTHKHPIHKPSLPQTPEHPSHKQSSPKNTLTTNHPRHKQLSSLAFNHAHALQIKRLTRENSRYKKLRKNSRC